MRNSALGSVLVALLSTTAANSEPLLSSWYTTPTGSYARIYDSLDDMQSNNAITSWRDQETPAYAGVHEISASADWVYIKSAGLGFHVMGPWYFDEAKTEDFGSRPANTASIYRFPKASVIPDSKTATRAGTIGYFVDGIAMFDSGDTFSYDTSEGTDQQPMNNAQGDGIWNRDAYINEGVTFDNANAHQAMTTHHYHANPPALRHLLGDSVDFESSTNVYTENFNGQHSPILGWVQDGLPIYGPYGYDDPDPASTDTTVRRMISGYQHRDGTNGSTNLSVTGRTTLPEWCNRVDGRATVLSAAEYGPEVNAEIDDEVYTLGRYFEDYTYKGDLGLVQGQDFDLNEYNVRFCRTPEFPEGTWAYFTCILEDGTPTFPYNIATRFFGDPVGGNLTSIDEDVEVSFVGGPARVEDVSSSAAMDDTIVITWSVVEGGSYRLETTADFETWDQTREEVTAVGNLLSTSDPGVIASEDRRFYRLRRTGLADYDDAEFGSLGGGPGGGGAPGGGPPGGGPPNGGPPMNRP